LRSNLFFSPVCRDFMGSLASKQREPSFAMTMGRAVSDASNNKGDFN